MSIACLLKLLVRGLLVFVVCRATCRLRLRLRVVLIGVLSGTPIKGAVSRWWRDGQLCGVCDFRWKHQR